MNAALDNDLLVPLPGGLSAAVILAPVPWAEVAAGTSDADNVPRDVGFGTAFDGIESLSWYVEASFASPFQRWERTGRYRFGVFIDGRERTEFRSAQESRGHVGGYLSFDQLVWQSRHDRRRQLGAFARAAYADRDVSPAAWSWSFGLEQTGLLRWRPRDVLGLGVYQLIGSSVYRSEVDPDFDRETGVEVYYAARVLGWLVVTPDVQVIVDPGATGGVGTAVIGTLRTRVTF